MVRWLAVSASRRNPCGLGCRDAACRMWHGDLVLSVVMEFRVEGREVGRCARSRVYLRHCSARALKLMSVTGGLVEAALSGPPSCCRVL